jgi:hypothetical protein
MFILEFLTFLFSGITHHLTAEGFDRDSGKIADIIQQMQIRNCKRSRAKPEPYDAGRLKGSGPRGGERRIY